MIWRNTDNNYGLIAILLHWLVAVAAIGLFVLGFWMVELDYYDDWYHAAPALHKSIGMSLLLIFLIRIFWTLTNIKPSPLSRHLLERIAAKWMHVLLLLFLFLVLVSGYLIPTAEGKAVNVFSIFSVPAVLYGFDQQENLAGRLHQVLAYLLVGLVFLHGLAALKHHFFNKDQTLMRMLRIHFNGEQNEN